MAELTAVAGDGDLPHLLDHEQQLGAARRLGDERGRLVVAAQWLQRERLARARRAAREHHARDQRENSHRGDGERRDRGPAAHPPAETNLYTGPSSEAAYTWPEESSPNELSDGTWTPRERSSVAGRPGLAVKLRSTPAQKSP